MSNPLKTARSGFVISQYNSQGDCIETHVVSEEAHAETKALLNRLEQRRRERDKKLMSVEDALRELEVPEADRPACGEEICGFVAAQTRTDGYVDFTQTPFERRFFVELCKQLPNGYQGSWIERDTISRALEDSYHDLAAMEQIVHRLADSAIASKASIDGFQAGCLLRKIAYAFDNARSCYDARLIDAAKQSEPA